MAALEEALVATRAKRLRMIATDGVFSMDGDIAPLERICDLAERHDALVMVDDSHATGFLGKTGRGSIEHCGVMGRVDVVTSTLGKALGGAAGGFTTGRREIVELLRQRSRPYLFSNTVAGAMLEEGIYVIGFSYPVVPKGQSRIRVQMSAVHDRHHLEKAVEAFAQAGKELGLVGAAR